MIVAVYTFSGSLKCVKYSPLGGYYTVLRCHTCPGPKASPYHISRSVITQPQELSFLVI